MVNPFAVLFNSIPTKPVEVLPVVTQPEGHPAIALWNQPLDTSPEGVGAFIREHRVWLKRTLRESGIAVPAYSDKKQKSEDPQNMVAFIGQHRKFLDALIAIK
jgi:hypothetical protein